MNDIVFIHGLRLNMHIGIFEWEQQITQPIDLDIDLYLNTQASARTENLSFSVDYSEVAALLRQHFEPKSYQLIETLAEDICAALLAQFKVAQVKLKLTKPLAVAGAAVGVVIIRPPLAIN